jgi:hypothetical protein
MIIFSTPFTGKTPWGDGFKSQEWFDRRADIYIEYTLKCLEKQTDKDFLIWLQFRPEEESNPTTKKIEDALKKTGLQYILTFNSPIMMEDRAIWHNIDLKERTEKSMKVLEPLIKEDWVCEVNLDSDDMVSHDFTEVLKSKTPFEGQAFNLQKGYMMEIGEVTRLAEWNNPISMSIYAIVYPTKVFLDPKEHWLYQRGNINSQALTSLNSHEQIPQIFKSELLPDGMFCCLYNHWNISTLWNHPFRGQEIYSQTDKNNIINKFL